MSRFILSALRSGSGALRATLPLSGDTTGIRSSTDNSGDLYYAVLDSPVRYRGAQIHQVILRPAERGQAPHYGMRGFAVEIAPVTDPVMRRAEIIDPALLDFVAVGEIDDASNSAIPPPEGKAAAEPSLEPAPAADRPLPRSSSPGAIRPGRGNTKPLLISAAAGAVLVAGLATMWLTSSNKTADPPAAPSSEQVATAAAPTTTAPSTVAPVEKPEAVLRLLPPGYPAGACTADTGVPLGALGAVTCTRNTDPGGPGTGRYIHFADKASMQTQFDQVVRSSTQQVCPGRIMSPGPWRHNATPEITAGTLFCGLRQGNPLIAWTDDTKLLLAAVDSTGQPSMEDMFKWWASHS